MRKTIIIMVIFCVLIIPVIVFAAIPNTESVSILPAKNSNLFLIAGFIGIILLYLNTNKTIKLKDEK